MIEILFFLWLASLLLSLPITALNFCYAYKLAKSAKYSVLTRNLAKIGLYWSLRTETFAELKNGSPDLDARKAMRTYLQLGGLGFLSVPGLLFLILLSFSLTVLAKSRLARNVFRSELVRNSKLSSEEIGRLVSELDPGRL